MAEYARSDAKDVARQALRGIFTAFALPEDRSGLLDEAGLRHDVEHCIAVLGTGGLYVHGFYANFWLLTPAERRHVLEVVVDQAGGRVPIIARCAHPSVRETVELITHAEAAGADFVSLLGPAYADGSPDMVVDYFTAVAGSTRLGISVFNTAQAGYVIPPETLSLLADIPNVVAVKNHVALGHTLRLRDLVGQKLMVVDPDEERMLINGLEYGQQVIFTGANMMYDSAAARPMHDYVAALLAGDTTRAVAGFYAMEPVRRLHHERIVEPWVRTGRCPIAEVKAWSGFNGMTGGDVRTPLPRMAADQVERLAKELATLGLPHRSPQPAGR